MQQKRGEEVSSTLGSFELNKYNLILLYELIELTLLQMSTERIVELSNTLTQRFSEQQNPAKRKRNLSSIASDRAQARLNYETFTSHSKQKQKEEVQLGITARRNNWKQDFYRVNNTFSIFPKKELESFPHNNDKYNVQFLDRSLHGRNLRFPSKEWGYFKKPQDQLYSNHYKPIVKGKRSLNETFQLRTSLFGQTWVDEKRDHIVDEYKLQANPFRTPLSNALISTMKKDKRHYHKL